MQNTVKSEEFKNVVIFFVDVQFYLVSVMQSEIQHDPPKEVYSLLGILLLLALDVSNS